MPSLIGSEFRLLERAVAAREKLQEIHSSNIANASTPNYKANTTRFEDLISVAQSRQTQLKLRTTRGSHIEHAQGLNRYMLASPNLQHDSSRMDGNTVNLQHEMVELAENQLMHEFTVRILKGKITSIANAIKEGGR